MKFENTIINISIACFTFKSKFLIDLEICFEVVIIVEFLLNFFSYFNKALSPFFYIFNYIRY